MSDNSEIFVVSKTLSIFVATPQLIHNAPLVYEWHIRG
jgi:hypothetical protein